MLESSLQYRIVITCSHPCLLVQNASKLTSLTGHDSWVLSVAHNPTQAQFASASSDKSVKIWDIRARECIQTFRDLHKDQVWDVAYKPDGTRLVSVSDDRSMIVYDVSSV